MGKNKKNGHNGLGKYAAIILAGQFKWRRKGGSISYTYHFIKKEDGTQVDITANNSVEAIRKLEATTTLPLSAFEEDVYYTTNIEID